MAISVSVSEMVGLSAVTQLFFKEPQCPLASFLRDFLVGRHVQQDLPHCRVTPRLLLPEKAEVFSCYFDTFLPCHLSLVFHSRKHE